MKMLFMNKMNSMKSLNLIQAVTKLWNTMNKINNKNTNNNKTMIGNSHMANRTRTKPSRNNKEISNSTLKSTSNRK